MEWQNCTFPLARLKILYSPAAQSLSTLPYVWRVFLLLKGISMPVLSVMSWCILNKHFLHIILNNSSVLFREGRGILLFKIINLLLKMFFQILKLVISMKFVFVNLLLKVWFEEKVQPFWAICFIIVSFVQKDCIFVNHDLVWSSSFK